MIRINLTGKAVVCPTQVKRRHRDADSIEVRKNKLLKEYTRLYNLCNETKFPSRTGNILLPQMARVKEKYQKLIKKQSYDRNNNLSINGTNLNVGAKTRIKNLCASIYRSGCGSLKFITLSLPRARQSFGGHEGFASDSYYVVALGKLLDNLKCNYGLRNYFWVAERQMKNSRGAIHFHCLFDMPYVSYVRLSRMWSKLLAEYHTSSDGCVDGDQIHSLEGISIYLSKYLTKQESGIEPPLDIFESDEPICFVPSTKIYCRTWAMSRKWSRLSKSSKCVKEITYEDLASMCELSDNVISNITYRLNHNPNLYITIIFLNPDVVYQNIFACEYFKKQRKRLNHRAKDVVQLT